MSLIMTAQALFAAFHASPKPPPFLIRFIPPQQPLSRTRIDIEELILTVQTLIVLQTTLNQEVGDGIHLYAGGLNLCNIVVELFMLDTQSIDFNLFPPFVAFLVFKAAAIVTQRLLMDKNSYEDLKNLKILRKFLRAEGKRWLSCERYLMLLNEDTTPQLLKSLDEITFSITASQINRRLSQLYK
ncbi:hypothetical protein B0O99DRAFT_747318 [Bisporella sp. PMI_857]|nr:hypothetical protein B0O99DRAFT_747318 [Bisporella sp. PMI_857]